MRLRAKRTATTYTLQLSFVELRALQDALGHMKGVDYSSNEAYIAGGAMYDDIMEELR